MRIRSLGGRPHLCAAAGSTAYDGAVKPTATAAGSAGVDDVVWYHTIELPDGRLTPGRYDLRPAAARIPLPARLDGLRCLDVGSADGFWAFEMERRGAAEVVATDVSDPARMDWRERLHGAVDDDLLRRFPETRNQGFAVAHRLLGSRVQHLDLSVYDFSPDVMGEFDFAFVGSLLLHLRDPVRALSAIRGVLHGSLLSNDFVSVPLTLLRPGRPAAELHGGDDVRWLVANRAGHRKLIDAAGFTVTDSGRPYLLAYGAGRAGQRGPRRRSGLRELTPARVAESLLLRFGVPHSWVLAHSAR
jgi:tRNA (mo5U34)-methyltransferase